jgi:hypothetical protein
VGEISDILRQAYDFTVHYIWRRGASLLLSEAFVLATANRLRG